MHVLTEKISR